MGNKKPQKYHLVAKYYNGITKIISCLAYSHMQAISNNIEKIGLKEVVVKLL